MAITRVQTGTFVEVSGSSSSSPSITLAGSVAAGNALVLVGSIYGGANSTWTISSVSDGGDTFVTRSPKCTYTASGDIERAVAAYAVNVSAGSKTIVANMSGAAGSGHAWALGAMEYAGVATSSPESASAETAEFSITTNDISAGGSGFNTDASDLIIGTASEIGDDTTLNWASPSGWTNLYRQNDGFNTPAIDAGEWLPGSAQTNYLAQWTHDNLAGMFAAAAVFALKAAATILPRDTRVRRRKAAVSDGEWTAEGWYSTGVSAEGWWDRSIIQAPSSGAPGAISGTAAITFAQTGALLGAGALSATVPLVFGQTGTLRGSGALTGTTALTFGQTGAISGAGALAGSAPIVFGQTGAIVGSGILAGTTALVFGQTGSLAGSGAMAASATLTFGQTGDLQDLGGGSGAMVGTAGLLFGQTGLLAGAGTLSGSAPLTFAQTGAIVGAGALAGTAALTFAQTGSLTGAGALVGTAQLVFGGSATADTPSGAMTGAAALLFGQAGSIAAAGALAGTAGLVFGASATADQPEQDAAVTGGWPIYRPRRPRSRAIDEAAPEQSIEALQAQMQANAAQMQARLLARQQLRRAEQRDRGITEQIRAIYAEQDALKLGILSAEAELEQREDDVNLSLILALAS